ncbi:ALP1-like protein isoform X1 [Tanacetum coccineum]
MLSIVCSKLQQEGREEYQMKREAMFWAENNCCSIKIQSSHRSVRLREEEDGTEIHMLAEKKYPLTKETLERMLSLRLIVGTASEDAYTLLRFIQAIRLSGKTSQNSLIAIVCCRTIMVLNSHVHSKELASPKANACVLGSNNDLNVLDASKLFDGLIADIASKASFVVNGKTNEKGYYLADKIYPQWDTFAKMFSIVKDEKSMKFKRVQEIARKDIERVFGVLQGRCGILQQPTRAYQINMLQRIIYCCIILHNMILKDQEFVISEFNELYVSP